MTQPKKKDVSLFSNLSLTSSKQLSRFSDSLIHSVFIECSKEPGMNKALFQRVLAEVQVKESYTSIANPSAYLRAAVTNALHAAQKKKEQNIAAVPKEKSAHQAVKIPFVRKEVLPDWFDKSTPAPVNAVPEKSKTQLKLEVEAMRRKLRGESV